MSLKLFLLIMVNVTLGVAGQTLIKVGVNRVGGFDFSNIVGFFLDSFSDPLILLGEFLYALSAVLWLVVLSKADLSLAYPLLSLGYILVLFISAFYLSEPISITNLLGVVLICGGVVLVTR